MTTSAGDPARTRLERVEALPAPVRSRLVARVAAALPDVPRLPPALRRVASFAPARRARLGAGAILAALADDDFRDRASVQLGTAAAAEPDPDPVDEAVRLWLLRPAGWEDRLAEVVEELPVPEDLRAGDEVERLRHRLEQVEQATREQRAAHRAAVEEYKAEVATLRRKLGESRTARAGDEDALREAQGARAAAEALAATQDKELRRLRGQVAQLEGELAAARSADRAGRRVEREEAGLRARVLLDTVLEAAAGLQRELGLPPLTGAPGDRVEAAVAATCGPAAAGVAGRLSPAMLEQLLSMPRARLVVDGYNVSKTAWPDSSLEAQRIRLLNSLAPVVARSGAETTVVFDAAAASVRPVVAAPRGVKVLFSPPGVIADDVIRDLVAAEPPGRATVVVTSDRAVVEDVVRAGARGVPAQTLVELLTRTG
ncbi:NYN domain-containing protein [Nocardioides pantholopis]|uniref:NYN domain-containing protein n=1 Tax=Nocardioides pantholopis TaxID=2483798 RepID=UPI000FDC2194|nr:NYN domain-containing protein [Nocardioides pantholopis]